MSPNQKKCSPGSFCISLLPTFGFGTIQVNEGNKINKAVIDPLIKNPTT